MFRKETLHRNALPLALGGGALLLMMLFLGIGTLAVIAGQNHSYENSSSQNQSSQNQSPLAATEPDGALPSPGRMSDGNEQPGETAGPTPNSPAYVPPDGTAPDAGGEAVTSGYWDRQRSEDQRSQAFSNSIRDNNTIQDTGNGEVSTVTNPEADSAIARGEATEVPTSQLPTSYDSGSASAAPESSAAPETSAGTGE